MTSSDSEKMITTMQGSSTAVPIGKSINMTRISTTRKDHASPSALASPPTPDTSIDMSMDESRDETTSLNLTNSSFGMDSLNSSTSSEEEENSDESSDDEPQSSVTSHEHMLTHQITEEDDDNNDEEDGKNHAIKSIEEALEIQKRNFGEKHPTIARTLHSLALEYRSHQQYDRAMMHLREALDILDDKLESIRNRVEISSQSSHGKSMNMNMKNMSTITTTSTSMNETNSTLEQKSALCACLANIYKLRQCYKEAMEYYLQSINLLVEANHPGDSPRISMLMRIMKRMESARKQSQSQGQMR